MFPPQQINVVFIIFILSFNVNNCSRNIWITQINFLKAAIIKHIIRKHLYNISAMSSKYILIQSDWTIEDISHSIWLSNLKFYYFPLKIWYIYLSICVRNIYWNSVRLSLSVSVTWLMRSCHVGRITGKLRWNNIPI